MNAPFVAALLSASVLLPSHWACAEPPAQAPLTNYAARLRDGDIVFIESHSERATAIKELTGSDLTHCGIVFNENGKWMVYEGQGRGSLLTIQKWQTQE